MYRKNLDLYMSATGQSDYDSAGQYTGATISKMGEDGSVCNEQGKDACGIVPPTGPIEDGAVCKVSTNCKGVDSCCSTFAKKSGGTAESTKSVCFPAGNDVKTSFEIPVVDGITAANLDAGKGYPIAACPAAPVAKITKPVVKPAGKIADGEVCTSQADCKGVDSCCNTFAKKSGVAAVSTK